MLLEGTGSLYFCCSAAGCVCVRVCVCSLTKSRNPRPQGVRRFHSAASAKPPSEGLCPVTAHFCVVIHPQEALARVHRRTGRGLLLRGFCHSKN